MKRLRRSVFLLVEDELHDYHETLEEIERLRTDAIIGRGSDGDENVGGGRSGRVSDETCQRALALVSNRRLEHMVTITSSIGTIIGRLQPEKRELVELMYWSRPRRYTWDGLALEMNITKRTAFRWRKEILCAIADRAGLTR